MVPQLKPKYPEVLNKLTTMDWPTVIYLKVMVISFSLISSDNNELRLLQKYFFETTIKKHSRMLIIHVDKHGCIRIIINSIDLTIL